MKIQTTSRLNNEQKEKLEELLRLCREKEPITLSFPFEDADLYLLCKEQDAVLSACALTSEGDDDYECTAFTAPEYRRQGIFTELLDTAIGLLPEDSRFLFYTDHKSTDAAAALEAYEAEPLFHEHMMELSELPILQTDSSMSITLTESVTDGILTYCFQSAFGIVNFSVFSSYYYLYGFEIAEAYRGKGYGSAMLSTVLNHLKEKKSMPVRLQVSGDNLPALSLYKKTGFHITETLSCYLY